MRPMNGLLIPLLMLTLAGCPSPESDVPVETTAEAAPVTEAATTDAPAITFGDGERNWIVVDGATREGATLVFPRVRIDGNGWLVLHPFENGKPVGARYVGASFLRSGDNESVAVRLDAEPETGEFFLVMLHRDVNENEVFDFVFVDERNVLDKAVFEGTTMIAHPFQAP